MQGKTEKKFLLTHDRANEMENVDYQKVIGKCYAVPKSNRFVPLKGLEDDEDEKPLQSRKRTYDRRVPKNSLRKKPLPKNNENFDPVDPLLFS